VEEVEVEEEEIITTTITVTTTAVGTITEEEEEEEEEDAAGVEGSAKSCLVWNGLGCLPLDVVFNQGPIHNSMTSSQDSPTPPFVFVLMPNGLRTPPN